VLINGGHLLIIVSNQWSRKSILAFPIYDDIATLLQPAIKPKPGKGFRKCNNNSLWYPGSFIFYFPVLVYRLQTIHGSEIYDSNIVQ